ncbi:MAG TPA: TetR/AcrR family transcriptional regulator [Candidatus Binatia bacterium]
MENPRGFPPLTGKREHTKAENRAAILAAARVLFADPGFEATTIRDVIRATDLAAGTFYNYFRDKESVLRALLDEKMAEMQQRARDARRGALTVEEIVQRTIESSFAMLIEDRAVFHLLRRNAGAVRAILDEPSFVAVGDELKRELERSLERSGAAKVDAEYLTAAISGIAFEVAAAAVDRPPGELPAAADFAVRLVLGGVAALLKNKGARVPVRRASRRVPGSARSSDENPSDTPRRPSAKLRRTSVSAAKTRTPR